MYLFSFHHNISTKVKTHKRRIGWAKLCWRGGIGGKDLRHTSGNHNMKADRRRYWLVVVCVHEHSLLLLLLIWSGQLLLASHLAVRKGARTAYNGALSISGFG